LRKLVKNAIFREKAGIEQESLVELGEDAFNAGCVSVEEEASTVSLEDVTVDFVTEDMTEVAFEGAVEGAVEDATWASLGSTGIGIFAAVAIDVIFGAINGAKEKEELKKQLNKLKDSLNLVNVYLDTVNNKTNELKTKAVEQLTLFKNISSRMTILLPVDHKPVYDYSFESKYENLDKCIAAQYTALKQFGCLMQLRTTYEMALKRNPNVTKDTIINAVLLTQPGWVDYDLLLKIWDQVLAKYSTLMKNAK